MLQLRTRTAPQTRAHMMVLALQASVKLAESDGVPGCDLRPHQQRLVGGEAVCWLRDAGGCL
jgi:hypothetical protein